MDFAKFRILRIENLPADLEYLDLLAEAEKLICCSEFVVLFGFSISSLNATGKYYFY